MFLSYNQRCLWQTAAPFQHVTQPLLCLQPTDDIVLMAQALEKIFLQKVAQMPQEEVELLPPAPKGKGRKPASGTQSAGKGLDAWGCSVPGPPAGGPEDSLSLEGPSAPLGSVFLVFEVGSRLRVAHRWSWCPGCHLPCNSSAEGTCSCPVPHPAPPGPGSEATYSRSQTVPLSPSLDLAFPVQGVLSLTRWGAWWAGTWNGGASLGGADGRPDLRERPASRFEDAAVTGCVARPGSRLLTCGVWVNTPWSSPAGPRTPSWLIQATEAARTRVLGGGALLAPGVPGWRAGPGSFWKYRWWSRAGSSPCLLSPRYAAGGGRVLCLPSNPLPERPPHRLPDARHCRHPRANHHRKRHVCPCPPGCRPASSRDAHHPRGPSHAARRQGELAGWRGVLDWGGGCAGGTRLLSPGHWPL